MPNRLIKESICTSANLNDLTTEEEIFFYRLIVNCDDYGRFDARPTILRAKCFPLKIDCITDADIEKWLSSLVRHNLVTVYEVDGLRCLAMITWENHQQVRAKRSKYPSPDGLVVASDNIGNQMLADANECPRNPIQSNPNPNPYMVNFSLFWSAFPKKKAKGDAEKAFKKLNPDEGLMSTLLSAIEKAKKSDDWLKDGGKFIPHPATWLNGQRWEDEITEGGSHGKDREKGIPGNRPAGAFDDIES